MSDSGIQTATGNDEYLLPAQVLITSLFYWIDTPTVEVDYRSVLPARRQLHAGWIATASGDLGVAAAMSTPPGPSVTWSGYFDFEANGKQIPSGFPYDDRVVWNIPSGIIAKFWVFW
jgi:hypothetical protein